MESTSLVIADNTTEIYRSQFVEDLLKGSKLIATAIVVVNVYEDSHRIQIKLGTTGFLKRDFRIQIKNKKLLLFAEKSERTLKQQLGYYSFGIDGFKKSFKIPLNIDTKNIGVHFMEGTLVIDLPKIVS